MQAKITSPYQLLRLKQVITKTGMSRSNIYKKMMEGNFPRSLKLGIRTSAWLESDIDSWIETKIDLRSKT